MRFEIAMPLSQLPLHCSLYRLALWVGDCCRSHFFPKIESDRIGISATLPYGAPIQNTAEVQRNIESAIETTLDQLEEQDIVKGVFSTVGAGPLGRTGGT